MDGSVQDCSDSSVLAMELLQSCMGPLIYKLSGALIVSTGQYIGNCQ